MKYLYIDMDGVLSNFEKGFTDMFGMSPKEVRDARKAGAHTTYSNCWAKFIDNDGFTKLEMYPGAEELLEFIRTIPGNVQKSILTSTGGFDFHNTVTDQKLKWIEKHDIPYQVITVPGRRFKSAYATKDSFIIDDTDDVVLRFEDNGGSGSLHRTAEETIIKLKHYFGM